MKVIIYVNGKRVTMEELSQYEVTGEKVGQVILQAIKRKGTEKGR